MRRIIIGFSLLLATFCLSAQDTVRYTGTTLCNSDYHHGQLSPIVGVHNIQVLRASREHPQMADVYGWTYNHGPNMAYWNGTFFVQYLSNPVSEHEAPGQVYLSTSENGYHWEQPIVLFPPYKVPDGTTKEGVEGVAKDNYSVLHQRVGFYVAPSKRLLTMGYFGICITHEDSPNDGKGIGRAVREIYKDGSLGPIYFIRYNKGWNEENTDYPFYQSSNDKGFIEACDAMLADPLMMQQWVEEADRDDPLIPLKEQYKAFSYYHLNDGRVVGLWKHALTSISNDGGQSWEYTPTRAPGFVTKAAKIWGQKMSDGTYATVYNPSQFRWPLAVSLSNDGLEYTNLHLINGEISTMRYGGQFKSYGPQYIRGILEGNGTPPDGKMWLTYSMNKEDIWVSSVPAPALTAAEKHANDVFAKMKDGKELDSWNIYAPLWAPVKIEKDAKGEKTLVLRDKDPFDYAVAEKIIPASKKFSVEFEINLAQNDHGLLHVVLADDKGNAAIRMFFNNEGNFMNKDGYGVNRNMVYEANRDYKVKVVVDLNRNFYEVFVDGERKSGRLCFQKVEHISRVMFRTGERRYYPTVDSPRMQWFDVENSGAIDKEAVFTIKSFKTSVEK
ncbi:sialidase family protein [Roseimarinus sediminis]|uniref:hypothetical protein n=1 Tax=Roseimarinus sediminis TaxID=1610899 RepID=UPI003D25DE33